VRKTLSISLNDAPQNGPTENYAPERKRKTPYSVELIVRELLMDPLTTQTPTQTPTTPQPITLSPPLPNKKSIFSPSKFKELFTTLTTITTLTQWKIFYSIKIILKSLEPFTKTLKRFKTLSHLPLLLPQTIHPSKTYKEYIH
jgi:hypothetical protein